jgi:hypothetical protein
VCFRPVLKLRRSSAFSGDAPAKFPIAVFRRILLVNHVKKKKFCCLLLVIDVSDRPRCFSARTDQVIVASDRPRCFSARTNPKIVASDRPWCFSARTDQVVVQVSDKFSTGVEVLFNLFRVFVLCTPIYSSLRGSIRICFLCFSFACTFQVGFI